MLQIIQIFDDLSSDSEGVPSIRPYAHKLYWMGVILTLDSPSDIRKYKIERRYFGSETEVRQLMSRRKDFSKEAVAKVKIEFIAA